MAAHHHLGIPGQPPYVADATNEDGVVGSANRLIQNIDTERRYAVVSKILELIITPHDHKIRIELIERLPYLAGTVDHSRPVLFGGNRSLVPGPFLAHRRRSSVLVLENLRRNLSGLRTTEQEIQPVLGFDDDGGIVRNTQS